jgi:hypothetical protein
MHISPSGTQTGADGNSGTAQKQRAIPVFSQSSNRWRPSISAENAMSSADNFVQKQQKQPEASSGRPPVLRIL